MITIRRDINLQQASEITKIPWQKLSDEIIRILKPNEDSDEGYSIEQFADEYYSLAKLLADIKVKPTSRATKAIGKLIFWRDDADNACPKCGYELIFSGETITDDELGCILYEGTCPICQTTTFIQK
jgi:hypothetical protein